MIGAARAALVLLALPAICACRRPSPVVHEGPKGRPARPGECASSPALPVARFAIHWSDGSGVAPVEVCPDGEIRQNGGVVARVSGACVVDPAGGVIWSVGTDGAVTGAHSEMAGKIQRHDPVVDPSGVSRPVGEILSYDVEGSHWFTAVSTDRDGLVFLSTGGPPSAVTVGMDGDFRAARRTALLLLAFGTENGFDAPPSR